YWTKPGLGRLSVLGRLDLSLAAAVNGGNRRNRAVGRDVSKELLAYPKPTFRAETRRRSGSSFTRTYHEPYSGFPRRREPDRCRDICRSFSHHARHCVARLQRICNGFLQQIRCRFAARKTEKPRISATNAKIPLRIRCSCSE